MTIGRLQSLRSIFGADLPRVGLDLVAWPERTDIDGQ